jgi:hypothetical protein
MKGLRDIVSSSVETAFSVAEELVRTGTYTSKTGNGSYDPVTDTKSDTTTTLTGVRFLPSAITLQEREASPVSVLDSKFLVPAVDLGELTPTENDSIVMETGERWNVLMSKPIPELYIIFARRA